MTQPKERAKIRRLDPHTINKIAAGEVIENPASVVKELVENSIDAGAKRICVEIKDGGRTFIRVTDNGTGMSPEDALLCLEKHATSKITSVEDLWGIQSLGFRGEAIPSIASISKFKLLTKEVLPKEISEKGTLLLVEGGMLRSQLRMEASEGTTVEVSDLFFNVPVRKNFQRSPKYDIQEVQKVIISQALAYPELVFSLVSNRKRLVSTGTNIERPFLSLLKERIAVLLDERQLLSVDYEDGGIRLMGWIALPHLTRPNRRGQVLMINRRVVNAPALSEAVRQGFGPTISQDRHPFFVLHLSLSPELIDVNVHPQKKEVRFQRQQELNQLIFKAIDRALQPSSLSMATHPVPLSGSRSYESEKLPWEQEPLSVCDKPLWKSAWDMPLMQAKLPIEGESRLRVVATLKGYLILEGEELRLIDQHAAHARVIYERLLSNHAKQGGMVDVQPLLIPEIIEVTMEEAMQVAEKRDEIGKMGIEIEEFGRRRIVIQGLAEDLSLKAAAAIVKDVLQGKDAGQVERRLSQMASQSAVGRQKKLTREEGQALVDRLIACSAYQCCPQGNPIMIKIDLDDIKKYGKEASR